MNKTAAISEFHVWLRNSYGSIETFYPLRLMIETLSRQHRWQILQKQLGNCPLCGKPSDSTSYCLPCAIKRRERQREKCGSKRRYNAASYRASIKLVTSTTLGDVVLQDAESGSSNGAGQGTIMQEVALD